MPMQPIRAMHGTRSHRSTARTRLWRLTAALAVVVLILFAFPPEAHSAYVYVDAGHGGRYPGAVYGGVSEERVNLLLALEVRAALAARGHRVGMTRTSDATVGSGSRPAWHWDDDGVWLRYCDSRCDHDAPISDLQARVDKANEAGADMFISIHNNAAGSSARGSETYHNWDNDTDLQLSKRLATYIQQEVVAHGGTRDRGVYGVGFYVVRWSNMPAVLVEVAFLSNSADRALLLSSSFRRNVAIGIADAVDRYLATDPYQPIYPRVAGENRYATAVELARESWPTGADTVFLASGYAWPDSLAATPLAVDANGPILLAGPGGYLPPETAEALAELGPSEIVVLGGTAALGSAVETAAAEAAGIPQSSVARIAGRDRAATAVELAEAIGVPDSGSVFLVSSLSFPDALSASSHAGSTGSPILMTLPGRLPDATREFFEEHAADIDEVYVLGGSAVIEDALVAEVGSVAGAAVTRISGPSRYETNLAALRSFWPRGHVEPYVARATDFPDALVAGVVAAQNGEPILLTGTKYLPSRTREFLLNDYDRVDGFTIVGGEHAVSTLMEWMFVKAMAEERDW